MARLEALEAGYDDVIWLDQAGYACEGPASNIFAVKDGVVHTPGRNVLRGITRQTFIELARNAGLPLQECDLTAFDLYAADEVFTCSTAGGALAVREIAGRRLPQPCPGRSLSGSTGSTGRCGSRARTARRCSTERYLPNRLGPHGGGSL